MRPDRLRILVCCSALALVASCGRKAGPTAIDPTLAACVPPEAVAVAGIRLDEVRGSPVFTRLLDRLPGADTLAGAASVLFAYDGRDLVLAARGTFSSPPAGFTAVAPGIFAAGPDAWLRGARDRERTRQTAEPALLAHAGAVAAAYPVWAAFLGGRTLPLSGNAANLNRLLRGASYATFGARFTNGLELRAAATCPSEATAAQLEESVRAMLTLARAGTRANAGHEFPFDAIRLSSRDRVVNLEVALAGPAADRLVDALLPPR